MLHFSSMPTLRLRCVGYYQDNVEVRGNCGTRSEASSARSNFDLSSFAIMQAKPDRLRQLVGGGGWGECKVFLEYEAPFLSGAILF